MPDDAGDDRTDWWDGIYECGEVPFETRQRVVPGVLGVGERVPHDGATTGGDRST